MTGDRRLLRQWDQFRWRAGRDPRAAAATRIQEHEASHFSLHSRQQHRLAPYPTQGPSFWGTLGSGRQGHEVTAEEKHQASHSPL